MNQKNDSLKIKFTKVLSKIVHPNWDTLYEKKDIPKLVTYLHPEDTRIQALNKLLSIARSIQTPGSTPYFLRNTMPAEEADRLAESLKENAVPILKQIILEDKSSYTLKPSAEILHLLYRNETDETIAAIFSDAMIKRINQYLPREYTSSPKPPKIKPSSPVVAKEKIAPKAPKSLLRKVLTKDGSVYRFQPMPDLTLYDLLTGDEPAIVFEYEEVHRKREDFPWIGIMPVAVNYGKNRRINAKPVYDSYIGRYSKEHSLQPFIRHSGPFKFEGVILKNEKRSKLFTLSKPNKLRGDFELPEYKGYGVDSSGPHKIKKMRQLSVFDPENYGYTEGSFETCLGDKIYVLKFHNTLLNDHLKGLGVNFQCQPDDLKDLKRQAAAARSGSA